MTICMKSTTQEQTSKSYINIRSYYKFLYTFKTFVEINSMKDLQTVHKPDTAAQC